MTATPATPPICRSCRHANLDHAGAYCNRAIRREFNPVHGWQKITPGRCSEEREPRTLGELMLGRPKRCGPEGRYFEPKP